MPVYSAILFEVDGPVATLRLSRPEGDNALNTAMGRDIQRAMAEVEKDSRVRALILSGAANVFCAEPDVGGLSPPDPDTVEDCTQIWRTALASVRACRVPVVVALNGAVTDTGILLALSGDWILAATSAEFVHLFGAIETAQEYGLSYHLPPVMGYSPGNRAVGATVSANQAVTWGIINECLEGDHLLTRAREVATLLAEGPTRALVLTRQLVDEGANNDFAAQCRRELEVNRELRECFDGKEGVQAFLEKRPAQFRGE